LKRYRALLSRYRALFRRYVALFEYISFTSETPHMNLPFIHECKGIAKSKEEIDLF